MARDDRLKKVQEAGADFLETARARAEEFLREMSKAGDATQERAQGAFDDLLEGSRKGTEQLVATIRAEIANQLGTLGLATKGDLAALEARLTGKTTAAKKAPATKAPAAKKTAATKSAGTTRKAAAKKAPAKKAAGPSSSGS